MPISKESTQTKETPYDSVVDPKTQEARIVLLPSEVAKPTRSNTAPQQASTQPGDGSGVHGGEQPEGRPNVIEVPAAEPAKVPFKEQVIGVAKKTRGTLLGKPDLKQHGEMILEGKATAHDDPLGISDKKSAQ